MKRLATPLLILALTFCAAVIALYAAEFYIRVADAPAAAGDAARDTRDRLQVVLDLRADGVDAYPAVFPQALTRIDGDGRLRSVIEIDGREVLPLGGISRRTTVTCNESGQYAIYDVDEHGFNNPPGAWDSPGVDLIALGDSFTYGNCVPADQTIVAQLRRAYPRAVNLGLGGVGPLIELAVLREYGPYLRPAVVLWIFYEGNDMRELQQERNSDLLMGQLAGAPPQGLRAQQAEIDRALMRLVETRLEQHAGRPSAFGQFVRLTTLRQRLAAAFAGGGEAGGAPPTHDFALLGEVFAAARAETESWGGQLVLVYLPGRDRYFGAADPGPGETIRRAVLDIAADFGFPVIDLVPVFAAQGSPRDLFVDASSHLTGEGYAFVAGEVIGQLRRAQPDGQPGGLQ